MKQATKQELQDSIRFDGECWVWNKGTSKSGYGRIWHNGKSRRAHRVAYELYIGDIPEGKIVCHSCDIPACINPEHLWLGTTKENTDDMIAKGRMFRQSWKSSPHSKLTPDQVRYIRYSGVKGIDLARAFGISRATVSMILNRKRYANVV